MNHSFSGGRPARGAGGPASGRADNGAGRQTLLGVVVWMAGVALCGAQPPDAPLAFNRDIRPILADKCLKCHGPDARARQGKLRLDLRADAVAPRDVTTPIVPGKPEESEVMQRIEAAEPDDQMPPADSGLTLSAAEKATLRRWIAGGAEYQPHWAFVAPTAASLPAVRQATWPRQGLDHFVLARLEQAGLVPSVEADPATLLRRVSLDLTGLPPTPADLDAFLADRPPQAYERVVDRLLASPAYGERMASDWLDAARYADSNGFFRDNTRQVWPWRDWVIGAFNRNLPFDQFTVEQLAGDLLPAPTEAQRIATGFNRNHMVTGETGVIDEEYRVEYVADRLETTATVWLGLTVGCARCHDHKYDPISQRDYYQLFGFFNSGVEKGLVAPDDPPPVMDVATPEQRGEWLRRRTLRQAAETAFATLTAPLAESLAAWERSGAKDLRVPSDAVTAVVAFDGDEGSAADPALPRAVERGAVAYAPGIVGQAAVFDGMQHLELPATIPLAADQSWTIGVWVKPSTSLVCVVSKIEPAGDRRGFELLWAKGQLQLNLVDRWITSAIELVSTESVKRGDWTHLIVSYDGSRRAAGVRVFADGQPTPMTVVRDSLRGSITNTEPLRLGRRDSGLGYYGQLDEFRLLARSVTREDARTWFWAERLQGGWAVDPAKREARQRKLILDCYVERHGEPATQAAYRTAETTREAEDAFRATLPKTLVMAETAKPRSTHVLKRGQYDAPAERVEAGVPAIFPPLPDEAPRNRLGLARWLTAPSHPLTARVTVNRLWQQCFGEGLVPTVNDFGAQGDLPSHPELLDWLAVQFVHGGWDVKHVLRLLVTSATYRQTSVPSEDLLRGDPQNRLYARGPRFRLPAEMIRDQALAASGLLVTRLGGPPVKPYQPPGLWEAVSYNGELSYRVDRDDGLWRRTVYSHWKRTAPPPGVQIFDGPTRETCSVRRPRTNTPLQALLLLNDETFVEAARALAAEGLALKSAGDDARLTVLFRRVLARRPDTRETELLLGLQRRQRVRFEANRAAAEALLAVGQSPLGRGADPIETASWTMVAQAILNLDETVTRR